MQINDSDIETVRILEDLYRGWDPNDGQVAAGKALFNKGQKTQFIRWGRKGGKTDYIIKAIYRYAMLNPNAGCYYFCPQANQAREILWETGRLQRGIPKKYIRKIKNNDMRIILKNGSFIKLDGSDNYEKHRGTEGHFLVYDEFKDFDRRFHEAIDPNRGVYDAPLIILGTPPVSINEDRNYEQYMELQKQCMDDDDKFFLQLSSYVNVHNVPKPKPEATMEERIAAGKAYLAKKRQELINRGEEYRWKIEYMAENVSQGKNAVFPMLTKENVMPFEEMHDLLLKDQKKLDWYCIADPATSTCFAVLFICLNSYTKEIWCLDQLYIKDRSETTTRQMLPKIHKKMRELAPLLDPEEDWHKIYDEAGAWFANEALDQVDKEMNLTFIETDKQHYSKEDGIALAKDTLIYKTMYMSSRCYLNIESESDSDTISGEKLPKDSLYWEMEQSTCIDGKYVKAHDHLVDCYRYFLEESDYNMVEALEIKNKLKGTRKLRNEDDLWDDMDYTDDWTKAYEE